MPTDPYGAPPPPAGHGAPDAFAMPAQHREKVLGVAGYTTPAYRNDAASVTAMVLGIIGIIIPGVCLFAIAAGHLAMRRLRTSYDGGRGLAVAGLVMGYVMLALWGSLALLALVTSMMMLP